MIGLLLRGGGMLLRGGGRGVAAAGRGIGRVGRGAVGLGAAGLLGYALSGGGGNGEEQENQGDNVNRAGGGGAGGGAGMGPGGLAGSAARATMSGGGSLPSVRGATRASVSPTMTTNKLLVVAINYLASIDQTLKNQLDTERSIFTQQQQAVRETGLENSGVVPQDGAGGMGAPTWAKNLGSGLLDFLKSTLIMSGLLGLPFIVEKLKEGYQYVSDAFGEVYDWTTRQLEAMSGVVNDTMTEIGNIWNWVTGSGEAENDGTLVPQETASGIGGGNIGDEIATVSMLSASQVTALESMGIRRDGQNFKEVGDGAAMSVDQVEKALQRKFNTSGDATESFARTLNRSSVTQFLKTLPGAGFLISLGLATLRLKDGDFVGAGLELIAGLTPFGNVLLDYLKNQGIISTDRFNDLTGNGPNPQSRINPSGPAAPIERQTEASRQISERVLGENRNLNSPYGMRNHPVAGGRKKHEGYDLRGASGDPLMAYDDGTVTFAGDSGGASGNLVKIDLGNGYEVGYSHLSTIAVEKGQKVKRGDVIGAVGSTGRSTGPHLHFSVKNLATGKMVDPSELTGGQRREPPPSEMTKDQAIAAAAQIPGYNISTREAQEEMVRAIQQSGKVPSSMVIPSPTVDTSGQIAGYTELFAANA